jgi:hypothetical protein
LSLATNGLPTEEDLKSFGGTSVKSVGGTNLAEIRDILSSVADPRNFGTDPDPRIPTSD